MRRQRFAFVAAVVFSSALTSTLLLAAELTGAGATFPEPVYIRWAGTYGQSTGTRLVYQPVGSGLGIARVKAGLADFGASDAPLNDDELRAAGLTQFPAVIGGVVPVFNLPGIGPGKLRLTGHVLGDIYLGRIKRWNDRAIADLNPELHLPDENITVVHRADSSGTTFLWTQYLAKMNPDWEATAGVGLTVTWPTGVAGDGNAGVASYVRRTHAALGYVEFAYAVQVRLSFASVRNREGHFVEPTVAAFQAAASIEDWAAISGFRQIPPDQPGNGSWPIVGASFILMPTDQTRRAGELATIDFFRWALTHGQTMATELGYVPIPPNVVEIIQRTWKSQTVAAEWATNRRRTPQIQAFTSP
jgi:phosphate transport system substrate-binding protein